MRLGIVSEGKVCPHCGMVWPCSGFWRHVEACAKRPGWGLLEDWHRDGMRVEDIAARVGVSEYMIRRWMREEGYAAEDGEQLDKKTKEMFWVYPGLAPLYGEARGCEYCSENIRWVCGELARRGEWVLCEAPDERMLRKRDMGDWVLEMGDLEQDLRNERMEYETVAGG